MQRQERDAERAQAAREALAAWGWEDAELRLIKHRENTVFEAARRGERRAVRLHRRGYHSDAEILSELQWIQALAEDGLRVAEVIPDNSGNLFVNCEPAGLEGPVQVDVFRWMDGEPLGSVEAGVEGGADEIARTYFTIGELAARVHNQAAAWTPPEGFTRHAWDEDGLAGSRPWWGRFWELPALSGEQRRLMKRVRDFLHRELRRLGKTSGNYSMIHADFAPENLMVDGENVHLIDFDDAGFGWHLFELVTSVHFIQGEDCFEPARQGLINGYRSRRALTDEELDRWPLFVLVRATTDLGWVHTRPETETARELTPMLIESACETAEAYLGGGSSRP